MCRGEERRINENLKKREWKSNAKLEENIRKGRIRGEKMKIK